MLRDLGHPAADGEPQYDVTFENVQAGERTSHLFRLANYHNALVLGTGDLSELALGWSTYGVGDQMSHYSVNASVPKSLIRFLIRWAIDTSQFAEEANAVLADVVETAISPELIPVSADADRRWPRAELRGHRRPLRAPGLLPLLRAALRLPPQQGRLPRPVRVGRPRPR